MKRSTKYLTGSTLSIAALLAVGWGVGAGSTQTPNRIPKFVDGAGGLGDSEIRESDAGDVAIGGSPNAALKLFVNGGRTGLRSSTNRDLGTLAVVQNGPGAIASFRGPGDAVALSVDAEGIDLGGSLRVAGEEIVDASGRLVGTSTLDAVPRTSASRIAQERWWAISNAGPVIPFGESPFGLAFDGERIWVATFGDGRLHRIRPRDGVVEETFTLPGCRLGSLAYDGAAFWASCETDLIRIRPEDGAILTTRPGILSIQTTDLLFDGRHLWIADFTNDRVLKFDPPRGEVVATVATGAGTTALVGDGRHVYAANGFDNTVTKIRASNAAILGTFAGPGFLSDVTYDGRSLWLAGAELVQMDPDDGSVLASHSLPGGLPGRSVLFDGRSVWVATSDRVVVFETDGSVLGSFVGSLFDGFVFDGSAVWGADIMSNRLRKF